MKRTIFTIGAVFTAIALLAACGSSPEPVPAFGSGAAEVSTGGTAGGDGLDPAIREISDYLDKRIVPGSKAVFLNIKSDYPDLSDYILSGLSENAVNAGVFSVVDRQQLDAIRAELDFQWAGEVDDNSAQEIGKMLGAQSIVSGSVSKIGSIYRIQVRAVEVQSAKVQGQFSQNVDGKGTIIAALTEQVGPEGSAPGAGAGGQRTAQGGTAAAGTRSGAASSPATPAAAAAPQGPVYDKEYKIGDKDPAGGIVFYDKGSTSGGWRYLEAAPPEIEFKTAWGKFSNVVGGTSPGIGKGKDNTRVLVQYLQKNKDKDGIPAQACAELEFGGFQDWFWPSSGELNLMYRNLKENQLGGFSDQWYWSSSENHSEGAWAQSFKDGEQNGDGWRKAGDKSNTYLVRAVRQF